MNKKKSNLVKTTEKDIDKIYTVIKLSGLKMRNILSVFVLINLAFISTPQQQSNWQNYSDLKFANDLIIKDDTIYTATRGGAFSLSLSNLEYETFNKAKGLNGVDLTSIGIDETDKVWFGSSNGMIDVYDKAKKTFRSILDIYNSDKTSKRINDFAVKGDTVFIASDFGISLVDAKSYFFYDTYFKFGSFTSNIKVNSILISDLIYLGTENGVAIQKIGAINLSAPESWNVYNQDNGLPPTSINKLQFYNGNLIAATNLGLSVFDGSNWQIFLGLTNTKILDMIVDGSNLYLLTPTSVLLYNGNSLNQIKSLNNIPTHFEYSSTSGLLISTSNGILQDTTLLYPNGPAANQFTSMIVDKNGYLWTATGKDVSGVGINKFNGLEWETLNSQNSPELAGNSYYSIFTALDNTIYSGSWGLGFVRINQNEITRFHTGNTGMVGIPTALGFLVITGFAEDSRNNIWILNLNAADRKSLYMLTPDSAWYSFGNPLEQHGAFTEVENLVIDQFGTKWYSIGNEGSLGLFYYNEKGTYSDLTDDVYGYITKSRGLSSDAIYSLAVDRRGDLWVGTSLGTNIISNLNTVLTSSNPQLRISNSFAVRQQTINDIAVDPLNQKWLGTNQGLLLLNSDGTQLIATLNSSNSPILSDKIESLAIDEKTGRVYVGTANGLTSFDTPSILPAESFNGLNVYPNPLILSDGNKLVTIDGLIRNTDIKIVSVSGKLVREFSSPGGRVAFWDGRDDNGNLVNSGVYIIIAFDQEGNNVETSKVAVIRE